MKKVRIHVEVTHGRQYLEVPHSVLPASLTDTIIWLAWTIGILERATVQRHAHHHFIIRNTVVHVVPNCLLSVERRAVWVVVTLEQVGLMAGLSIPGPSKVICHQVDEVEVALHGAEVKLAIILRASRCSNGQQEMRVAMAGAAELGGIGVQRLPSFLQQQDKIASLVVVLRILPVDVKTIETEVLEELDRALCEALPAGRGGGWRGKVGTVRPAADGEKNFEVTVALLEEIKLLDAAIYVGTDIIPRVARVVFLHIGPAVGHVSAGKLAPYALASR